MSKQYHNILGRAFALIVCALAGALYVQAGALMPEDEPARKWVSPDGDDSNPCSRTQPCRTFGAALSQVAEGGEIVARDSGGYAPLRITKSVRIVAPPGVHASIDAPADSTAVVIQTQGLVVLRNLSFKSQDAQKGIVATTGTSKVVVEHCVIDGFAVAGIDFGNSGSFFISDTVVRDCKAGISIHAAGYFVKAELARVRVIECGEYGIRVASARAMIRDSTVTGTTLYGFAAMQTAGGNLALMHLENCTASDNGYALASFYDSGDKSNATMYVSNSTIVYNGQGVVGSGLVISRGNNTLAGPGQFLNFNGSFQAK